MYHLLFPASTRLNACKTNILGTCWNHYETACHTRTGNLAAAGEVKEHAYMISGTYLREIFYHHRLPHQHQYSYFILTPVDQGFLSLTLDSDWGRRTIDRLRTIPLALMLCRLVVCAIIVIFVHVHLTGWWLVDRRRLRRRWWRRAMLFLRRS